MTKPVRWGIVGTGTIARTFARDLRLIDEGVVVAVGSRSAEAAQTFGEQFAVPRRYDSYEALVGDAEVDAVYVATPHPWHHAHAALALEADKAVLVEKSFTMNAAEARDLVTLSRSRGLFLMEAMWTRFLPHVVELRAVIERGEIGELVTFEADHGKWFAPDPTSRLFAPELGGGALLDLGVYPVSFASMLLGKPERVLAMVEPSFSGVDAQATMIFRYPNGAHALLSCTSSARSATRACVTGTLARIEIEGDFYAPSAFTRVSRAGERSHFEFPTEGRGLHYEAREVARCLDEGLTESPIMPLDESISIMETMEEVLSFA